MAAPGRATKRALLGAIALIVVVAAGLAVASCGRRDEDDGRLPTNTSALASVAADCSTNVEAELTTIINAARDGSTVRFPPRGCYAQGSRIEVRDKRNLTIDGNGSSFKSTAPNSGSKVNGNWLIVRGSGVRIKNMRIVGNFHLTGARSQQRVNEATVGGAGNQFNMGVGIYGGRGNHVTDLTIEHVFGDGVTVAVAHYVDGSEADPLDSPRDVHIERVKVTKAARHCYSPSQSVGFWLVDSEANDCWYGGLDAELDNVEQKLQDIHVLRNTFNGFNMFGIVVPVAGNGTNTKDIEIKDNTFLTFPTQPCNTVIDVGLYPANPNRIQNVTIEGNTMKVHGTGIALDHVDGGRVRDNRIVYRERGCTHPDPSPLVRVTNSTDVQEHNNGGR